MRLIIKIYNVNGPAGPAAHSDAGARHIERSLETMRGRSSTVVAMLDRSEVYRGQRFQKSVRLRTIVVDMLTHWSELYGDIAFG